MPANSATFPSPSSPHFADQLAQVDSGTSAYVTYVGVVGLFAPLLPDGADALSPFTYTPQLPAESMDWPPVLLLAAIAVALNAVGLAAFRRRDVVG